MTQWIQAAIRHHGALHRDLGIPEGQKIPRARIVAASKGKGKTAERARLALTLEHLHKNG